MRIAVCTTGVPFVRGGAELHARNLCDALAEHDHEVELITIPFKWYPPGEIVRHMLACRLLDLTESNGVRTDLVVALKFPAYLVNHPNKVIWVLHQHRPAYDLWTGPLSDLSKFPEGGRVRDIIIETDNRVLRDARRVFANSQNVARRLSRFNKVVAKPLYHPPPNTGLLTCKSYGDFIFCPSRLSAEKRQSLLVEAITLTKSNVRCIIAGSGPAESELQKQIASLNLQDRVTLVGSVSNAQLLDYYANARAVFFGPFDEDYGYVTLEALLSQKPVITLSDSGGPLEFVQNEVNGFVTEPKPQSIATVLDRLFEEPSLAEELGRRGASVLRDHNISWANVVSALLS